MSTKQKEGYFTAEGIDIQERIDNGKTKFFVNINDAEKYSIERRSYRYEVFNNSTKFNRTLVGYGVQN